MRAMHLDKKGGHSDAESPILPKEGRQSRYIFRATQGPMQRKSGATPPVHTAFGKSSIQRLRELAPTVRGEITQHSNCLCRPFYTGGPS